MARRKFSREYKLEAVRLAREPEVSVSQVARDLDLRENVLRNWIKQYEADPAHAFPGGGHMKPEQSEIAALKKEVRKLKAERDILKKAAVDSMGRCNTRYSVQTTGGFCDGASWQTWHERRPEGGAVAALAQRRGPQ